MQKDKVPTSAHTAGATTDYRRRAQQYGIWLLIVLSVAAFYASGIMFH